MTTNFKQKTEIVSLGGFFGYISSLTLVGIVLCFGFSWFIGDLFKVLYYKNISILIVSFLFIYLISYCIRAINNILYTGISYNTVSISFGLYLLNSFFTGLLLSPLTCMVSLFLSKTVLIQAFLVSFGFFGVLAAYSFYSEENFSFLRGVFFVGFFCMAILELIRFLLFFFEPGIISSINIFSCYFCLFLSICLTMYTSSELQAGYRNLRTKNPRILMNYGIYGASMLLGCFYLLFYYALDLILDRKE